MRDFESELLNPQSRERLMRKVSDGVLTDQEVARVIGTIGWLSLSFLVPDIVAALDHPSPIVRISALHELGFSFYASDWTAKISGMLSGDLDEDVRVAAAVALGTAVKQKPDADIFRTLRRTFSDASEALVVRDAARRAFLYGLHKPWSDLDKITFEEASTLDFDALTAAKE